MLSSDIITQTADHVKSLLAGEHTGHDWWHIHRVRQNALYIGRKEHTDLSVVELAALLHDIADWKFHDGDEKAGARVAREWLTGLSVEQGTIRHTCDIIETLSYKGAGVPSGMQTREGMVVQDADRLDALGAIGIARGFAYGGHKGRMLYDPTVKPELHATFEQYKKSTGPTINHFYEKLLLLKDRMNTTTGRELAEQRHRFMEEYLDHFHREWNGGDL